MIECDLWSHILHSIASWLVQMENGVFWIAKQITIKLNMFRMRVRLFFIFWVNVMITQATVMLTAYTKLLRHIFYFFFSSLSLFLFFFRSFIYWHMERNSITELYNFQNVTRKEQIRWNGFIFISLDVNVDDGLADR